MAGSPNSSAAHRLSELLDQALFDVSRGEQAQAIGKLLVAVEVATRTGPLPGSVTDRIDDLNGLIRG